MRVLLHFLLENCDFLNEVGEVFGEDIVELVGFGVELLSGGVSTVTCSR